jgi:TP901 family phage tail tape measure protein
MGMNAMGAGFVITAKDAASSVIGRIGQSFGGLGKQAKSSFEKMNMGAGASLGAMGAGLVRAGNGMMNLQNSLATGSMVIDRSMGRVAGRVGNSAEALKQLRGRLTGPEFTDLAQDANQITGTFARLVEETGSADDAMKQLRPSLELATAAGLDSEVAGGMLSDVLAQFKMNGDDAAATADKLAMTMNKAGILGSELEPMLAGTASGAALANQGLDDTLLAAGLIKARFPAASRAAGSLNMAMIQLSDPKVQQEIKAQGVAVRDNAGKIRPVVDIMGELAEKTAGMTEAQRANAMSSAFGGRAAGGLSVIMESLATGVKDATGKTVTGAAAVAVMRAEMEASTGTAQAMGKAMKDNYVGATERATKAGIRWADTWGQGAQSLRRPFLEAKAAALDAFSTLLQGTDPRARRNIMGVTTALGSLAKVVGSLVVAMGAMKMFGISFTDLIFTLGKAILIIGPLVVLLGGLAIGMYALYRSVNKNATGVGDAWRDMVGKIKLGWKAVVEMISDGKLSAATSRELRKTQNQGVLGFVHGFERFLERMKSFWAGLKKGFDEGIMMLGPQARMVIEKFKSIFSVFTGEGQNTPEELAKWGAAGAGAGRRLASFGETALTVLSKLADVIGVVVDRLSNVTGDDIAAWIDGAVGAFNTLADAIGKVADVLGVIGWVLDFVWHTLRVVGAFLGELVGNVATGVGNAYNVTAGIISRDPAQIQAGLAGMRDQATGRNFTATEAEAGDYARDLFGANTTVGMTAEEKKSYYKDRDREQAKSLQAEQEKISTYMGTTAGEWAAGARPIGAQTAFGNLDAGTQAQWLKVFDNMSKVIKDLGGRPVNLYVDREKIATAVGDSGTAKGTRSLDEGDALI